MVGGFAGRRPSHAHAFRGLDVGSETPGVVIETDAELPGPVGGLITIATGRFHPLELFRG
jgi:hypothetical protein